MKKRITISLEIPTIERLDTLRQLAKRSTFLEYIIKEYECPDKYSSPLIRDGFEYCGSGYCGKPFVRACEWHNYEYQRQHSRVANKLNKVLSEQSHKL